MSSSENQNEEKKYLGGPFALVLLDDALLPIIVEVDPDPESVLTAESDASCEEMRVAFHLAVDNDQIDEIKITQDSRSSTVETSASSSEAVKAADDLINALYDDYYRRFLGVAGILPAWTATAVDAQAAVDDACQANHDALSPSTGACIIFRGGDGTSESTCAIAPYTLKDVKKVYCAISTAAVEAKAAQKDPAASISDFLREIRRFYYAVFALAVKTKATPADAAKAALNAFSVVGEFCRGIFATVKARAALEDASRIARDAFNSTNSIYCTVFSALVTIGATLECATNAALDAFKVATGIYRDVFTAATRVNGTLLYAYAAAGVALEHIKKSYFTVLTFANEAKATPADAANAALGVFNANGKFYHNILAAVVDANLPLIHAHPAAVGVLKDLELFYRCVFCHATEAEASLSDATTAALNASSAAGNFLCATFAAALRANLGSKHASQATDSAFSLTARIYFGAFSAAIGAQSTPASAAEAALSVFNAASKLYHCVNTSAIKAGALPEDTDDIAFGALELVDNLCCSVSTAAVKARIAPLLVAKTICTAVDGLGAVYSEVLHGIHSATAGALTSTRAGAVSTAIHKTKPSSKTSADAAYQIAFDNVHATATFAGLDAIAAFFVAEKAAVAFQTVYRVECQKICANPNFARISADEVVNYALSAAVPICRAYQDSVVSTIDLIANAYAARALATQVDDAVERFESASLPSADHFVPLVL